MTAFIPTRVFESCGPCYDVCPHCKRQVIPYWNHDGGYVFPGDWQCPEHGSVTPMKSAVVNRHPYVPDWSAA